MGGQDLPFLVICFRNGLVSDQIHAVCGGYLVVVLDGGNVTGVYFPSVCLTCGCVRFSGLILFILLTRFPKVRVQLFFRFPPALPDGSHLLGAGRRLPVLRRALFLPVLAVLVAHKGIVPPRLPFRKTRRGNTEASAS